MKRLLIIPFLFAAAICFAVSYDSGKGDTNWSASGTSVFYNAGNIGIGTSSPGFPLSIVRSSAFTAGIDSVVRSSWTTDGGASGVAVGIYSEITATGTTAGTGHTIGVLGLTKIQSTGFLQNSIGVEGRSNSKAQNPTAVSVGVLGLGTWDSTASTGTTMTIIGLRGRSEVTAGDAATAVTTGTAIAAYLDTSVGGLTKYGVFQNDASAYNTFLGSAAFGTSSVVGGKLTTVQAAGGTLIPAFVALSGASNADLYTNFGRTTVDASLAVAGGAGNWFTGSLAGDAVLTQHGTSNKFAIQVGLNAVPEFVVANNGVGIGTTAPATFVMLDVATGTIGMPRYTTTQVSALTPSAVGQILFNTTINIPCYSTGTAINQFARFTSATTGCL